MKRTYKYGNRRFTVDFKRYHLSLNDPMRDLKTWAYPAALVRSSRLTQRQVDDLPLSIIYEVGMDHARWINQLVGNAKPTVWPTKRLS